MGQAVLGGSEDGRIAEDQVPRPQALGRYPAPVTGVPIKVISELLGHSTTRMALDVNSHVLGSMERDAAVKMDQRFDNLVKRPTRVF